MSLAETIRRRRGDTARPLAVILTDPDGTPRDPGPTARLRLTDKAGAVLLERPAIVRSVTHPTIGDVAGIVYDLTAEDWALIPTGTWGVSVVIGEGEEAETYPTDPAGLTLIVFGDGSAAFSPRVIV